MQFLQYIIKEESKTERKLAHVKEVDNLAMQKTLTELEMEARRTVKEHKKVGLFDRTRQMYFCPKSLDPTVSSSDSNVLSNFAEMQCLKDCIGRMKAVKQDFVDSQQRHLYSVKQKFVHQILLCLKDLLCFGMNLKDVPCFLNN